jgi:hypothetical protein
MVAMTPPTVFSVAHYECMTDEGFIPLDMLVEQLQDFTKTPLVQYRVMAPVMTKQGRGFIPVLLPADKVTNLMEAAAMTVDRGLMQPLVVAAMKAQALRQGVRG